MFLMLQATGASIQDASALKLVVRSAQASTTISGKVSLYGRISLHQRRAAATADCSKRDRQVRLLRAHPVTTDISSTYAKSVSNVALLVLIFPRYAPIEMRKPDNLT